MRVLACHCLVQKIFFMLSISFWLVLHLLISITHKVELRMMGTSLVLQVCGPEDEKLKEHQSYSKSLKITLMLLVWTIQFSQSVYSNNTACLGADTITVCSQTGQNECRSVQVNIMACYIAAKARYTGPVDAGSTIGGCALTSSKSRPIHRISLICIMIQFCLQV